MAISKDIAIHDEKGISDCLDYVGNIEKTTVSKNYTEEQLATMKKEGLENVFSYAENANKTSFVMDGDEELLISGVNCTPETASVEFAMDRDKYAKAHAGTTKQGYGKKVDKRTGEVVDKQSIQAYHIIQSFPSVEGLDPRLVHKLGVEFAEKAFPGHRCVVCTHMNTGHLHNHIVENAYAMNEPVKQRMDMSVRRAYRAINDEISINYGLPILLNNELSKERHTTWLEWAIQMEGSSWKQKIKNDISEAKALASSWEEFVEYMHENGYAVEEKNKYVCYRMVGDTMKVVRDTTLGKEFTRDSIMETYGEKREPIKEKEVRLEWLQDSVAIATKKKRKDPALMVSRYTISGRRRSDLEIVLLRAIKIIRKYMDKYKDTQNATAFRGNPVHASASTKLAAMEQALAMVQELGLKDRGELKAAMNDTGIRLNQSKREVESLEHNLDFASTILESVGLLKDMEKMEAIQKLDKSILHIKDYSSADIMRNRALTMPMTPKQRKELFVKLEDNQNWKLDRKFDELTFGEAKEVLLFLQGKTLKPECLISAEEFNTKRIDQKYQKALERNDASLREKYKESPATPALIKKVKEIAKENNLDIDSDSLSMFDAIKVVDYYASNPFSSPLVTKEQADELKRLVKEKGKELFRNPECITQKEYEEIKRHLETGKGKIPTPLKTPQLMRASTKMQIEELLSLKGESCTVPLSELSQEEGSKLYTYLLNKGNIPEILKPTKEDELKAFQEELENLPIEIQQTVFRYRKLLDELASVGVTPSNIEDIVQEQKKVIEEYEACKKECEVLGTKYSNLSKLQYSLTLAETKAFTYGPLFSRKELDESMRPEENSMQLSDEQIEKESQKMDEEIQRNVDKHKSNQEKGKYFSVDESFFGRM